MAKITVPTRGHPHSHGLWIGIVKDVSDVDNMGRIRVYIEEMGDTDENNEAQWVTCEYASPFAGTTPLTDLTENSDYSTIQKSYGMWFPCPDIGNRVLVQFINGYEHRAVWFAMLWQQNMNHMVPGIPGAPSPSPKNINSEYKPSVEYNIKNPNISDPDSPTVPRLAHTPLLDGLKRQGLEKDYIRGVTTSGARRQFKSTAYGFLTPRGSQIVFDDGYTDAEIGNAEVSDNPAHQIGAGGRKDEMIRFRTRSGAQILISETFGMIYLISRDGNNWVEMANDGHIDVFADDDVSVHTTQSINLRADKDINIEAGRNINMRALGSALDESGEGKGTGNFYLEVGSDIPNTPANDPDRTNEYSVNSFHMKVHGNRYDYVDLDYHLKIGDTDEVGEIYDEDGESLLSDPVNVASGTSGNFFIETRKNMNVLNNQSFIHEVTGNTSDGDYDLRIKNLTKIISGNDFSIDSYDGSGFNRIDFNSGFSISTSTADTAIDTDTPIVYDLQKIDKNTVLLKSIVDRAPEHEKWLGHVTVSDTVITPTGKTSTTPAGSSTSEVDKEHSNSPIKARGTEPLNVSDDPSTVNTNDIVKTLTKTKQNIGETYPASTMKMSEQGITVLLNFEKFFPYEYFDEKGYSIGYGHLQPNGPEERFKNGLTEEEAFDLFLTSIRRYENNVRQSIKVNLNQAQFDALVLFAYNLGSIVPSLRDAVNSNDYDLIAEKWMLYVKAGRPLKLIRGLVDRRRSELTLFRTGVYPSALSRDEHKAAAINSTLRRWKQQDLEPRANKSTTNRQILQAYESYARMTGETLPTNIAGLTGTSGFDGTAVV